MLFLFSSETAKLFNTGILIPDQYWRKKISIGKVISHNVGTKLLILHFLTYNSTIACMYLLQFVLHTMFPYK